MKSAGDGIFQLKYFASNPISTYLIALYIFFFLAATIIPFFFFPPLCDYLLFKPEVACCLTRLSFLSNMLSHDASFFSACNFNEST